mmetsp:Transcript_31243/g.75194  ORF Transcript_31243/g.75194 Transcript_31243/m.75194 type:complete len:1234 (+) Transcript_31243:200-3901(+)
MIVVFVIDTSPSMGQPLVQQADGSDTSKTSGKGMSKLDMAKMTVEDIVRGLNKRVREHNLQLQQQPALQKSMRNVGLGFCPNDKFLLLSTGRQHSQQSATAACGAGGRLLVGYGDHDDKASDNPSDQASRPSNVNSFQKELKQLQATDWDPNKAAKQRSQGNRPSLFPEDGGGAVGLNAALSAGLQLLSRYRLTNRSTENFGMGRLPSSALLNPSGGGAALHALQPACLVLLTDGVCLRSPPAEGGGSLQLQYGNMPLREFYREPFRWDQRIFCLGVGGKEGVQSSQFLHPHLRTLCEVTGGSHMMLRSSASLSQITGFLLNQIAPPRPRDLPIPDPFQNLDRTNRSLVGGNGTFVSGGPVCCFQALEPDMDGQAPPKHRAMLLYVPHNPAYIQNNPTSKDQNEFQSPIWCIPESFFPSKKLDTLPPRPAQPNLLFARYPGRLGSKCFEASSLMKALARLDQLIMSNRKIQGQQQPKLLSRDVYICEWITPDQKATWGPQNPEGMEYFPVLVIGAGRPALNDGEANYFSIGILHTPARTSSLGSSLSSGTRVSTLTLLPPEPHILLPLLLRAAELEHRALKKIQASAEKDGANQSANITQKLNAASRNVHLDNHWQNEFRAYLFRLPPYYQNALKRSLRGILPTSLNALIAGDGAEGSLAFQSFSKNCAQKIRFAEQQAHERNERLENQEARLRSRGNFVALPTPQQQQQQLQQHAGKRGADALQPATVVGYGQFDPRSSTDSFLAALKNMPAPWRMGVGTKKARDAVAPLSAPTSSPTKVGKRKRTSAVVSLGDLPANCLMAYYESRRRWIFGGSGLSTRGLFIDGVPNDGCNSQQCGAQKDISEVSLLSMAGVGVSQLNSTTVSKMGDYRERLLWSRAPVVGYGSNDSAGVSATTAVNGAPVWSVDDDAMPVAFFDPKTGEFADSVQARVNSRLYVNFGNPYKDKRADSLVPLKFLSQSPSMQKARNDEDESGAMTPPGSPPHDSFSSIEGEGEAAFAGKPISRKSSVRKSPTRSDDGIDEVPAKRRKVEAPPSPVKANHDDTSRKHSKTAPPPPPQPNRGKSEHAKPSPPTRRSSLPAPPPPRRSSLPAPPSQPGKPPSKKPLPPPPRPPPPKPPPANKPAGQHSRPPPPQASPSPSPSTTKPPPPIRHNSAPPKFPSIQQQGRPNQGEPPQGEKKVSPPAKPALDLQSPEKKPNVNLPPGWMCVWSKSQKRWYFFDTKTNKSVWQWPPP